MPPLPDVPGVRHAHRTVASGVTLHVAEAGDPDAPAILAVHGWPQHWWLWRDVIPALARTHRVVCPDLRGLGWSGQPADGDFTKARFADDMLALLDLLGIERAGYLGHDWGGWAGWIAALRAPERISRLDGREHHPPLDAARHGAAERLAAPSTSCRSVRPSSGRR